MAEVCDVAHLMVSERLHAHAHAIMSAGLAAGVDVGIGVGTADEWLDEWLTAPPQPRDDPEVVAWRRAVGLPVRG